jgi:hypothetical protein
VPTALVVSAAPNPFNPSGVVTRQTSQTVSVDVTPDTRTPSEIFNDAYWAHFAPEVQALRDMPHGKARENAAETLAKAGHVIDVPIQAWGWDPWKVMNLRQHYGMQFVPSALMAGGPLDREVPGAIRVSLSATHYPVYAAAAKQS